MAKYDPLGRHLQSQPGPEVVMTFAEIEGVIGAALPPSAKEYPAWWANETNPDTRHVHSRAWLGAGLKASVDQVRRRVVFRKLGSAP